ncbi:DUF6650 family protein [Streptomyces sp. NPDC053048]|uniref:DUF6650 family protein n=1 Tax=Streptomyces sp. NPDC053048 TaxID=3365694 RepID=UPI0037D8A7C6
MKLFGWLRHITGFSTPVAGISWESPESQVSAARAILIYLEDRRVLTAGGIGDPRQRVTEIRRLEQPQFCIDSVLMMRMWLTEFQIEHDVSEFLSARLGVMRQACRHFLDTVGSYVPLVTSERFVDALIELRKAIGAQVALIAGKYKLDVSEPLSAILPEPGMS